MKLIVYKGFETDFLRTVTGEALSATPIADKRNVLFFSKAMRKQLQIALITNADEDGEWWVTYEEFSLIISNVESALKAGDLEVLVVTNNLYPRLLSPAFFNFRRSNGRNQRLSGKGRGSAVRSLFQLSDGFHFSRKH